MEKANVVLVGIGGYGLTYVKEIFEKPQPAIHLVGAVEPYPERCPYWEEFKKRNIPIYESMDAFFVNHSADLTVISTPIFLHTEHILKALEKQSNVLCEKPLCADEQDIERILTAQKESGKFVYIGYQWPYSDAISALKNDVQSGRLGDLIEMKTIVLRPRTRDYFERGIGWAGKIQTADGRLVYDSVANNSAAHYLYNMLYLLDNVEKRAKPQNISAELLRVNHIENFDVSKICFTLDGSKMCFIGAHPVNKLIEPVFEYRFTKGTVYYACKETEGVGELIPKEYSEYGKIVAFMEDGSKIIYGDPMQESCKKLHVSVKDTLSGRRGEPICGVESTGVHTGLINYVQKNFDIKNINASFVKEENNLLFAEGLYEKAMECFKNTDISFRDFWD